MARYPGASWRPLAADWAEQGRIAGPDLILLHTMVGSLSGTDGYFRQGGYSGTESHFGVGHDGTTYQWQDTTHRADANLYANDNAISIETADVGTGFPAWNTNDGSAVPAWTPAQLDRIVDLIVWACRTHDIPCVLIPDSRVGRRGIGYHRQGVPLRAGDTASQTGGELWSSAAGKVCPGNRRIAQIPGIIERARVILTGSPTTGGETEMDAAETAKLDAMHRELTLPLPLTGRPGADTDNLYGHVLNLEARVKAQGAKLDEVLALLRAGAGA